MLTVALLFVSLAPVEIALAQPPTISVDPAVGQGDPGAYYSANLTVADVNDLSAWELKLGFDPVVLALDEADVVQGPFLNATGTTNFNVDVQAGYVQVGCALTTNVTASGSGTLATLNFLVLPNYPGVSNLTLFDTYLYNSTLGEIAHTTADGEFTATLVPNFNWTPEYPVANETVTFNATASFSGLGLNITGYSWDFGDGSTGTGAIVNNTYTAYRQEPYIVNLTVTDETARQVSLAQELLIYREVVVADIWVTDQNWDETFTTIDVYAVDTYYPPYAIGVALGNFGTQTETFNVTLTFSVPTDLVGYGDFGPANTTYNVTLAAGAGTSVWYDWYPTDPAGQHLSNGTYTFTATATPVEGELDITNNEVTLSIDVFRSPPSIIVVPDTGIAATTVVGEHFNVDSTVTITWDGTAIPPVPSPLVTDSDGSFTAIISVLTQNEPGIHTINATDEAGNSAVGNFTVLDMTGPAGPAGADGADGADGEDGATGPAGPAGADGADAPTEYLWAALILAIIAILIAAFGIFRKA